jgi:hypothetical protein
MGNFLNNVIKSREEWLKKPNPIPNTATYLNTKAKSEALIKSNLKTNENAKPLQNNI